MRLLTLTATALLTFGSMLIAQEPGSAPETKAPPPVRQTSTPAPTVPPATTSAAPAKGRKAARTPMQQAPGGGPDQVWVNTNSSVYHCPGDRFYGKTAHGRYMTEAAAKSAGGKGVGGKTCSTGK